MKKSKTFTLIELALVVAIVAVLAGVIIPVIRSFQEDAIAVKIVRLAETLKDAAIRYHADTETYNQEFGIDGFNYAQDSYHHYVKSNGVAGWNGPYISKPLQESDNPYNDIVSVYHSFTPAPWSFDLDGDGTIDTYNYPVVHAGAWLIMLSVPAATAKKVNDILDSGVPEDDTNWDSRGRVEYTNVRLCIYLTGGIP